MIHTHAAQLAHSRPPRLRSRERTRLHDDCIKEESQTKLSGGKSPFQSLCLLAAICAGSPSAELVRLCNCALLARLKRPSKLPVSVLFHLPTLRRRRRRRDGSQMSSRRRAPMRSHRAPIILGRPWRLGGPERKKEGTDNNSWPLNWPAQSCSSFSCHMIASSSSSSCSSIGGTRRATRRRRPSE